MGPFSRISKRLVLSYIIDWVVIIATAGVGAGISSVKPNRRPFNVMDPSISFPYVKEKVSTSTLVLVGLVAPAIITFIVCLFIPLGPSVPMAERTAPRALRRKLWEWDAAWMGLALSLAIALFISSGTKNLAGKPRPDLLARCDPDLSRLLSSRVGGIGTQVDAGINLVSWTICRNTGDTLDEGFRSFPSGHSSFSFAGLTYLALFLCAKMGIAIPFLGYNHGSSASSTLNGHFSTANGEAARAPRKQAAAPPTYLIIFPLFAISVAIYVSSTRYSDFRHHGFDIIAGSILGIASAWLGFRWYHLPISRGGGWAWAPRSSERAFGRSVGLLSYVAEEADHRVGKDLESGPKAERGNGILGPKDGDGSGEVELDDIGIGRGYEPARASDASRQPLR